MLVGGKTIAQDFLANAVTRVHPVEWSTGTAVGFAAAFMVNNSISDTKVVLSRIRELQAISQKFNPINWYINGTYYPTASFESE